MRLGHILVVLRELLVEELLLLRELFLAQHEALALDFLAHRGERRFHV